jgi:sulfite reductase (NADPH) flavoprotein alpha-component
VQHALRDATDTLRAWVDDGAAIYVCGSLQGMAPGVDAVLREVLGEALLERMLREGRYRRDVY